MAYARTASARQHAASKSPAVQEGAILLCLCCHQCCCGLDATSIACGFATPTSLLASLRRLLLCGSPGYIFAGLDHEWGVELYGELLEIGGGKERMTKYFIVSLRLTNRHN